MIAVALVTDARAGREEGWADMGEPDSGRRTRALGTRGRVMSCLAANGEITDPKGMASTTLAEAIGYPGSSAAFAQLLSGMERSGLIEREIRGKRTYRIAPTAAAGRSRPAGTRRRAGKPGPPTAAGRGGRGAGAEEASGKDLGRDLAAAASGAVGFDYDELARRLLVQLVRRLAIAPGGGQPPGPGEVPEPAGTGRADTGRAGTGLAGTGLAGTGLAGTGAQDAALRQAVASLEQKLATVQSSQRRLTEENAQLREQLQAARQSLAQAEERASAGRIAGQLGSAEVMLLERLLSASREQADQQEEAGAG